MNLYWARNNYKDGEEMSKHDEIVKVLENKIFGFDDRAVAVMVRRDGLPYLATAIEQLSNSGEVIAEGKCKVKNVAICYRDGTTEWKQKISIGGKEFSLSKIDGKNIKVVKK